ncbi:LysR family transcriptional regulator, partial [Proteus mirabilis]|nr:LysR family transcriptional regulator [Proteus mirabilis]
MIARNTQEIRDVSSLVATNYWQTDNFQMSLGMVEAVMGWGNLPYSLIYMQLQKGKLKQIQFKNTK